MILAARTRILRSLTLCFLATLAVASVAAAEGRNPGSLLVFPEFDTTPGRDTLLTITNANRDPSGAVVRVEIVFLNGTGPVSTLCNETNATVFLTPNDTYTFLASALNPNPQRGYVYAFAKDIQGRAMSFNWLIGDNLLVDGVTNLDYSIEPYSFRALTMIGTPTDLDNDGIRDLDGVEYEMAPAKILVPRFLAQGNGYSSDLILINLSGGRQFTATIDFLVYNDNEEVFSRNLAFRCWKKMSLTSVSNLFTQSFLATTSHDPAEILGLPAVESGWFEMDGNIAASTNAVVHDPAFLAFLVERSGTLLSGAELAFEMGKQDNGDLLPLGLGGDTQ